MKKIIFIFALLIANQVFAQTIPFQLLPSGHIIVKATVEGKEGNFIFDTGGGINLFFNDFAKDLKQKSTYNFLTAFRATGERIDAPLFKSEEVTFAGTTFKNIPYSTFDMKLEGINGLISLAMLHDTDFVIDYDKKQLTLGKINASKHKNSFDIQLSSMAGNSVDIFTTIKLNNEYSIQVLLDSGAGDNSFWLSDKYVSLLKIDKSKLELSERKSEFNENVITKFYKGTIGSISNPYASLQEPKVVFVEGLIYEGKTSINWLGKKIGISLKDQKIYILD